MWIAIAGFICFMAGFLAAALCAMAKDRDREPYWGEVKTRTATGGTDEIDEYWDRMLRRVLVADTTLP